MKLPPGKSRRQGVIIMEKKIQKLKERIQQADAVIICAGAGLSTAAGFVYAGERFERYFEDFGQKYGFHQPTVKIDLEELRQFPAASWRRKKSTLPEKGKTV